MTLYRKAVFGREGATTARVVVRVTYKKIASSNKTEKKMTMTKATTRRVAYVVILAEILAISTLCLDGREGGGKTGACVAYCFITARSAATRSLCTHFPFPTSKYENPSDSESQEQAYLRAPKTSADK